MIIKTLKLLLETPTDLIIPKINQIFNELIQEISFIYKLDIIEENVKFVFEEQKETIRIEDTYINNIGVHRFYDGFTLMILLLKDFEKFIPMILVREAYNCFISKKIRNSDIVSNFIRQKVEIDLERHSSMIDWKKLIRNKIINYDFLSTSFDRLDKFLRRSSTEEFQSPFHYFLKYIRRYGEEILTFSIKEFYDKFYLDYHLKSNNYLFEDEIIEAIRIAVFIFSKVKKYRAFLDYKSYFKEFIQNGTIKSSLSLRKFSESMQWIKDFTEISPAYKINWISLGIKNIFTLFIFNPKLRNYDIQKIINQLPFLVSPRDSRTHFGYELYCYFVIPHIYLEDLKKTIYNLKQDGYIIKYFLFNIENFYYFMNLNYHRKKYRNHCLISPFLNDYDKNYEIELYMEYGDKQTISSLSLLDWLLIDRIRYFSITGFGFERRLDSLNVLKSDLLNEIYSQRNLISNLRTNLKILNNKNLPDEIIDFLEINQNTSFFMVKEKLNYYFTALKLIEKVLNKHPNIKNEYQFRDFIKNHGFSNKIEDNIIYNLKIFDEAFLNSNISLFFSSKKEFRNNIEKIQHFFNIFQSCSDLKIFNIRDIKSLLEDKSLIEKIYSYKEHKLNKYYESIRTYQITNKVIEDRLDKFSNSSVIIPNLIGTILRPYISYSLLVIFKNIERMKTICDKIKFRFPLLASARIKDLNLNKDKFYFIIEIPNLNIKEKNKLISILYNLFKKDLLLVKRYFWTGLMDSFSRKDFYDLEKQDFYYSKDLFENYLKYIKNVIGEQLEPPNMLEFNKKYTLWLEDSSFDDLFLEVEKRIQKQNIDLNNSELNNIYIFFLELENSIINLADYKEKKSQYFFKNFIKNIYFIPLFQKFGYSMFSLYMYPSELDKIDFRLLLGNTFCSIKYVAQIDYSNSFLINYIYPFRDPGLISYLNWLTKSKKVIREYCLFFTKKIYQVLHFNFNITSEGWDLDPNRFRVYFQKVLFDPKYNVQIPGTRVINVGSLPISDFKGQVSEEYQQLTQIYSTKPIDIKSIWGTIPLKRAEFVKNLLKDELIMPYISLENLNLIEKVQIIIPNIRLEYNDKLIKIFSFFNVAFIHEIEGEFYIHGFEDVIRFENGFLIILHLPDCSLDEFERLFDLIFKYMEIDHYIILNDLVDGKPLLNSIYGNLKFLEEYNPLTNLIWGEKDKRWFKHKLFDQNFKPQYPDLFFGKPGLCKRCGVSLEKGKLCAECLYQLASLKDAAEDELRKIIQSENQELYLKILKEVKILIEKNNEPAEIIRKVIDSINEKVRD